MNSLLTRLAVNCVRAWTWLYTWRMPPAFRETRRAEIESDLWEFQCDAAGDHRLDSALHILLRLLIGVPDDLGWRPAIAVAGPAAVINQDIERILTTRAGNVPHPVGRRLPLLTAGIVATVRVSMLPRLLIGQQQAAILIDDFESGTLAKWSVNRNGAGGWFIYANGQTPPEPSQSDPHVPFSVPDPPQVHIRPCD